MAEILATPGTPPTEVLRLRMTKVDEYQFLTCVKHSLWGSKTDRFREWHVGDLLVIFVDKFLAGLGRVSGPTYKASDQVWDNGLFPHRIPIKFEVVLLPDHRPPILGPIRDALATAFPSGGYGLGILNQLLVPSEAARQVVAAMHRAPNDMAQISTHLDALLAEAKAVRDVAGKPAKTTPVQPEPVLQPATIINEEREETAAPADETLHSKIQYQLIQLGLAAGCSVWIAINDKSRLFQGKPLGSGCLNSLPNLGLSPGATKKMSLIDVIWLRNNAPLYAFEVEATTSIYSGLLRMSDLLASVPALKLQLFVVAPNVRRPQVLDQLTRPTFDRIGLSEYCAFIPAEELEGLASKLSGLVGHIHPSVIETLKVDATVQPAGSLE